MDAGKVVELDHPHILLQRKGFLSDMVQRTGPSMAENLRQVALQVLCWQQLSQCLFNNLVIFRITAKNKVLAENWIKPIQL